MYQQGNERNFHFFYNLLAGASDQEAQHLTLYTPDNFYYVNQGQCFTVDGMNDAQDYQEVRVCHKADSAEKNVQTNCIVLCVFFLLLSFSISSKL